MQGARPRPTLPALLAAATLVLGGGSARADPPRVIRYQARLTDVAGVPLAGIHAVRFSLLDQAAGGATLWTEGPLAVDLADGSLDILLGQVTPLDSSLLTGAGRWLEIAVDGKVLQPRQRLASAPSALVTDRLGTKTLAEVEGDAAASLAAHAALPSEHHVKTTDASELLSGTLDPTRLDLSAFSTANLLVNGSIEHWPRGDSGSPLPWEKSHDLTGTVEKESTVVRTGGFSAKLTHASGILSLRSGTRLDSAHLAGRTFSFGVWALTAVPGAARMLINNDGISTSTGYHSGSGQWEFLTTTRTMSADPTGATVFLQDEGPPGTVVYFDGAVAVEGPVVFNFSQHPSDEHVRAVDFLTSSGQSLTLGTPRIARGETTVTLTDGLGSPIDRNERTVSFGPQFGSATGQRLLVFLTVAESDMPGDDPACYSVQLDQPPLGDRFVVAVRRLKALAGCDLTGQAGATITVHWMVIGD